MKNEDMQENTDEINQLLITNMSVIEKLALTSKDTSSPVCNKRESLKKIDENNLKQSMFNRPVMFLQEISEAQEDPKADGYHESLLEKTIINSKNTTNAPAEYDVTREMFEENIIDKENIIEDAAMPRIIDSTKWLKTSDSKTPNETLNMSLEKPIDESNPVASKVARKSQIKSSRYMLLRTIGRGNFAKVKLAQHIATDKYVAIKIIDKTKLDNKVLLKISREVALMKELNHPNIVKLLEVMENETTLYIVMEYASGGELFDYLISTGYMKEKEARIKFREMLSAVHYCHSKNIVHRDLKAENILLNSRLDVKVADFGFANKFSTDSTLDTFCGSPPYAAPELFQGKNYIGPEVDVWALGIILFTLVSGRLPFDAGNMSDLKQKVINLRFEFPYFISNECEQLLRKMLVVNVKERLTLDAVMKDPWVNGGGLPKMVPYSMSETKLSIQRLEQLRAMGYKQEEIDQTFREKKFNAIYATYSLLKTKSIRNQDSMASNVTVKTSNSVADGVANMVAETSEGNKDTYGKGHSQSYGGLSAANLARTFKNWFFKKQDTVDTTTHHRHSTEGVAQKQWQNLINDPNSSIPKGANQQAILATLNQMSITKHQKAGMFQAHTIGSTNARQIMNQASLTSNYKASLASTGTSNQTSVQMGKFTVENVTPVCTLAKKSRTDIDQEQSIVIPINKKPKRKRSLEEDANPKSETIGVTLNQKKKKQKKKLVTKESGTVETSEVVKPELRFDIKTKPRTKNFAFSMHTTSLKDADELMAEVIRILRDHSFRYEFLEKYLLQCWLEDGAHDGFGDRVQWEVEVCRVPLLASHGVRMKRIFGSTFAYKKVANIITAALKL